jgi:hypothetical protein
LGVWKVKEMKFAELELPSNKKFGYFFFAIFSISAGYFFYSEKTTAGYTLAILAMLLIIITFFNADLLLPLNKLWMRLGLLLGIIISPVVLGILFFGLITPYGIVLRILGRDELRLKKYPKDSHWVRRMNNSSHTNFDRQF